MLERCCRCEKIVWPGQQSSISYSPIHLSCHQESLRKSLEQHGPEYARALATEMGRSENYGHGLKL